MMASVFPFPPGEAMRRDGRPVPRLYVDAPLAAAASAPLSADQGHYLSRVMRLGQGDALRLFNGRDGEWLAAFDGGDARCTERLRAQPAPGEAWLLFAPPRKERLRFLVEKATELGVARLMPVTTARTEPPEAKPEKLRAWAIEAAEQCGRLDLPGCADQQTLDAVLAAWPEERPLLLCDEAGGQALLSVAAQVPGPVAFLVGPEGGFAPDERERLRATPRVVPVTLGDHILRVETAALAALASWQVLRAGDRLAAAARGASSS